MLKNLDNLDANIEEAGIVELTFLQAPLAMSLPLYR
jgi:hypothetical protein